MPRLPRCRRICSAPRVERFCPCDVAESAPILLTLDEYEVIRLVDLKQARMTSAKRQMLEANAAARVNPALAVPLV